MRRIHWVLGACLVQAMTAAPASSQDRWTLNGNAGISVGNYTAPSFGWWVGLNRWISPTVGLGVDAGRHRWDVRQGGGGVVPTGVGSAYNTLARGGQELQHLCGSLRVRGEGFAGSAASLTLGFGAYRQVIREQLLDDPRDGRLRQGFNLGFGLAGKQWITPAFEFRADWVDTQPRASTYFTAAVGVHLNH